MRLGTTLAFFNTICILYNNKIVQCFVRIGIILIYFYYFQFFFIMPAVASLTAPINACADISFHANYYCVQLFHYLFISLFLHCTDMLYSACNQLSQKRILKFMYFVMYLLLMLFCSSSYIKTDYYYNIHHHHHAHHVCKFIGF